MVKTLISALVFVCSIFAASAGFAQGQSAIDDKILTDYFAKNNIKATKTSSGLYYTITKKGNGVNAKPGQKVNMKYLGKFLDGKKFDANVDDNFNMTHPLAFTLGVGQVIRGWDEGVQLLNPGCRASLYIPSGLAYGPNGRGPIPGNSILVFDVELVSID